MIEIKLNKNQLSFFEETIMHFGSGAVMVKYSDLKAFAETRGLTIPTTVLKNYCAVKRGVYDLTKSGVEVMQETGLFALTDNIPEEDRDVFEFNDDGGGREINDQVEEIETPAYAPNIKPNRMPEMFKTRDPIKKKWINPVYVVTDIEGNVRYVRDNPISAYKACNFILHGSHSMTEKQTTDALKNYGVAQIICTTASSLRATITIYELNE